MKKMLSLLLALTLCVGLCVPAFAQETADGRIIVSGIDITVDIDEEIERALSGVTDLATPRTNDFNHITTAVLTDENGNEMQVDTYTTTREIVLPTPHNRSTVALEKVYATTGVALLSSEDKSHTGSQEMRYVTAYGTLYWRDNLGTNNGFLGASGGWDIFRNPSTGTFPSLSSKSASIEGRNSASDRVNRNYGSVGTAFDIPASFFETEYQDFTLHSTVKIDSDYTLNLAVGNSIWDQ